MYKYFIAYAASSVNLTTLAGNTEITCDGAITIEIVREVESILKEKNNFTWCGITNIVLLEMDNSDVIKEQKKIQMSRLRRRYLKKF